MRLRLGSDGPAKAKPTRLKLDNSKNSGKVKVHLYPPDQRKFLDAYLSYPGKMKFLKVVNGIVTGGTTPGVKKVQNELENDRTSPTDDRCHKTLTIAKGSN